MRHVTCDTTKRLVENWRRGGGAASRCALPRSTCVGYIAYTYYVLHTSDSPAGLPRLISLKTSSSSASWSDCCCCCPSSLAGDSALLLGNGFSWVGITLVLESRLASVGLQSWRQWRRRRYRHWRRDRYGARRQSAMNTTQNSDATST